MELVGAKSKKPDETTLDIDGRSVKITRPGKVLYPQAHVTKADIIDYYVRASPFILPHLKNRPVTLKRYPDGVTAEAYYEKDAPSFTPKWVETFPVPRRNGGPDINYILINDAATLAWTANIAALELHPFLHRAPAITTPTSVVFDLDPGPGADILTCIEVAFPIKDLFDRLGLELCPKVSGSKGLQVYLPLNTPITYAVTQPFAYSIAQLIERQNPAIAVSDMSKVKRAGKVFIDWSQNADFKTTVGVYSLRAKSERPFVSMPVTWEELQQAFRSRKSQGLYFEPKEALARLEKGGDLFAPLLTLQQVLPENLAGEGRTLREYDRKRDFSKTKEPAGNVPRRSKQGSKRRFVVQKHSASHLHYDFRLEIHGVLKSWAVPKGVPYELGVRRLASATEDYPIEYLDFEGVIPQGQYGGGTVMVWDIGTYEIVEGNYWKGTLGISLAGKKLKGEWMLQRDPQKGENAWILEKVDQPMKAISAKAEDQSALTTRTMEQIAQAKDATWQSNRPPAPTIDINLSVLPKTAAEFIEPMQCKLVSKLPEGKDWEYEAKFDGYRALVVKNAKVNILSRRNNSLTNEFPAIAAACADLKENTVIDGEIIALDKDGKPAFNILQNRRMHKDAVQFYAFDLLVYQGRSLLNMPLEKRRELLNSILAEMQPPVYFSQTLDAPARAVITAAKSAGLEGIVAKRRDSRYEAGKRSGAWSKFKLNLDQELVIGGYLPGSRGFDALLVGYYENKRLIFSGKVRNGLKDAGSKEKVFARFKGLGTKTCPFDNLPEPSSARRGMALTREAMELCCWLKPQLVAQIGIREWTADGHLRHATFQGIRDDKNPRDVVREGASESSK
jgi:bifunctional non-homologous end joining protein LigD